MNAPTAVSSPDPSLRDADDVASDLGVDPAIGLSDAEAARRLHADGPNELRAKPPVPLWRKILAQFQDPLIYLLLVAVAISVIAWWAEGAGWRARGRAGHRRDRRAQRGARLGPGEQGGNAVAALQIDDGGDVDRAARRRAAHRAVERARARRHPRAGRGRRRRRRCAPAERDRPAHLGGVADRRERGGDQGRRDAREPVTARRPVRHGLQGHRRRPGRGPRRGHRDRHGHARWAPSPRCSTPPRRTESPAAEGDRAASARCSASR